MPSKPYMHFYVGDWRKDPGVQSLDYEHRGVWMELLMFMDQNDDRGYLTLNGEPMSDEEIANLLGLPEAKSKQMVSKILANRVASQDEETGIIYNRKMVREEELRRQKAEAGRKGGLAKAKQASIKGLSDDVAEDKQSVLRARAHDNDYDNDISNEDVLKEEAGDYQEIEYTEDFEKAWSLYPSRPNNPKKAAFRAWKARIAQNVDPAELIGATARYAEYCRSEKIEPRYIKRASTFYGPDEHWRESYKTTQEASGVPAEVPKPLPEISDEDRAEQLREIEGIRRDLEERKPKEALSD